MTAVAAPATPSARTRLLLEGPIVRTLLRLAAPNLVVNVLLIAVTPGVDAHFIGRLSTDELAGVALVFPLLMLMQQMANVTMGSATAAAVARAIGAGRHRDAGSLALHGLLIASVTGVLFTVFGLALAPIAYAAMGGSGASLAAAIAYSDTIFAGAVVYWVLSALTSAVRGTGQVAILAWVYVGAELLHIGLVPLLVFGWGPVPGLGVTGAGLATILSFTASSAVLAIYLARGRTPLSLALRGFGFEWQRVNDILRTGVPLSLQPLLNNLALVLLTAYAATVGTVALTGIGIAVRLEYLMYPLVFGLGAAVVAMVGTNVGAGKRDRAIRIAWIAAALGAATTGTISLLAMTSPQTWIALFTDSPDIGDSAARYLVIATLGYAFIGANTLTQAFQAMGRTFWPMIAVLCRAGSLALGGWLVVNSSYSGEHGLAIVTVVGLSSAGTTLAVAFWRTSRRG